MRTLVRTLQDHDAGLLRIIAELWGIDLPSLPPAQAAEALGQAMLRAGLAAELYAGLPPAAQATLRAIAAHGRRMPMSELTRRFGALREMGPGRRDRERPWRDPASTVEVLWYRGWLGRAFADTAKGPQEFAYIPDDLAERIPTPEPARRAALGRAAAPPAWSNAAAGSAVDDATTLLAALRCRGARNLPLADDRRRKLAPHLRHPEAGDMLLVLLRDAGLLSGAALQPPPEAARTFLEAPRSAALLGLQRAWLDSTTWNDLAHVPGLAAPGDRWPNDPRLARRTVLGLIADIPDASWWDLQSFIEGVRDSDPAFQRPGGDFDSWYVTDKLTGGYLHGFASWPAIEGALLRYLIYGPLSWLGVVDIGSDAPDAAADRFRRSAWGAGLLEPQAPPPIDAAAEQAELRPDGRLILSANVPRDLRYQIARCCTWQGLDQEGYHYRLTVGGLSAAQEQGLQPGHVRTVLESAIGRPLPAALIRALERVSARSVEARLERPLVLRVASAAVLRELQSLPATARYLKAALGPNAVRVDERDWERLCAAALRAGLLIEPPGESDAEGPPPPIRHSAQS